MKKNHFCLRVFNGERLINEYKFDDSLASAMLAFSDEVRRGGSVYLYIFNDATKDWDELKKCERPDYD